MIDKLYKLKKNQKNQKLMQKVQIINKISLIQNEIMFTNNKIINTSVDKYGAISDFAILEIHKNTMKQHINKLQLEINKLNIDLEKITNNIFELEKETQQYKHILDEQKQEYIKCILAMEEKEANEYIQNKYIKN